MYFINLWRKTSVFRERHRLDNSISKFGEQVVHQLASVPWGHHMLILKKIKNIDATDFC